jgi:purine-binding chemotaxis protein CheW
MVDPEKVHLVFRAGARLCGLPVHHVRETMRVLPIEPLPSRLACIIGASLVRGIATPVLDVAALIGEASSRPARFVIVELDEDRRVALLVDEVLGVWRTGDASGLPPLLRDADRGVVEGIARRERDLLTILDAGRLLPEEPA